jgi:hypothetical protein
MHLSALATTIVHDLSCRFGMENAQVIHPKRVVTAHAPTECHWRPVGRTNHFSAHFSLEPTGDRVLCVDVVIGAGNATKVRIYHAGKRPAVVRVVETHEAWEALVAQRLAKMVQAVNTK